MDGKKILNILLMRSAFSTRNLTSLALVALFMCVYVAAGGKITTVPPNIKAGASFGDLDSLAPIVAEKGSSVPSMLKKYLPNSQDSTRDPASASRANSLRSEGLKFQAEKDIAQKNDKHTQEKAVPARRNYDDSLANIEERLNMLESKKAGNR